MTAGAFVTAVPNARLPFAARRADARIHIRRDASRRTASMNAADPLSAHTSAASDDASHSGDSEDEKQLINLDRL
jgi:hypothetical protein